MHPNDRLVHLTLTIPQARAMVAALDIYMRLGLGQIHMVAEMVADGSIPIKAAACKVGSLETPEMGCTLMSWNQPYRLVPFG